MEIILIHVYSSILNVISLCPGHNIKNVFFLIFDNLNSKFIYCLKSYINVLFKQLLCFEITFLKIINILSAMVKEEYFVKV